MARRTRLATTVTTPTRGKVRSMRPHPMGWKAALKLAKGDPMRIEVVSRWELLVHNDSQ